MTELFRRLENLLGSRVKAAEACGLERKTIYGWEKTSDLKLRTKKKVLKVLLDQLPEDTLEFMTRRSVESSVDILRIFLNFIYESAVDEKVSIEDFLQLASKFEEVKRKYAGLIIDNLDVEVGDMTRSLAEKASELKLDLPRSAIDVIRLSKLIETLPAMIKALSYEPLIAAPEIAREFRFPLEFVQDLSKALQESLPRITPQISYPIKRGITAGTIDLMESKSLSGNEIAPTLNAITRISSPSKTYSE
jgi:hypothetical protein